MGAVVSENKSFEWTARVDLLLRQIIFILISLNTSVPFIFHTKFHPNIPSHLGEMDLNAWVDINFVSVDISFQTVTVTFFRYRFSRSN